MQLPFLVRSQCFVSISVRVSEPDTRVSKDLLYVCTTKLKSCAGVINAKSHWSGIYLCSCYCKAPIRIPKGFLIRYTHTIIDYSCATLFTAPIVRCLVPGAWCLVPSFGYTAGFRPPETRSQPHRQCGLTMDSSPAQLNSKRLTARNSGAGCTTFTLE